MQPLPPVLILPLETVAGYRLVLYVWKILILRIVIFFLAPVIIKFVYGVSPTFSKSLGASARRAANPTVNPNIDIYAQLQSIRIHSPAPPQKKKRLAIIPQMR